MGQSYFIWNGIDCRSMGVTLAGPVAIVRPEERVNHVTVPGRSGDLTTTEGENVYNSYIQTATIYVKGHYRVREVYKWLRGAGYVTFSGEPDRRQKARIIGAVTLNKYSKNIDTSVGEVQFYCQPLKELLTEESVTVSSSGAAVLNNGDVTSRPLLTVTASSTTITVAAGGNSLTVSSVSTSSVTVIDCDVMEVANATKTTLLTKNAVGDFPVLNPGSNAVTGSGWSSIEIDRRERFL